jgi:hypothetical protein
MLFAWFETEDDDDDEDEDEDNEKAEEEEENEALLETTMIWWKKRDLPNTKFWPETGVPSGLQREMVLSTTFQ